MTSFLGRRTPRLTPISKALHAIYGVSTTTALKVTSYMNLVPTAPVSLLTPDQLLEIHRLRKVYCVFGDLLKIRENKIRKKGLRQGQLRFRRQRKGLPSHGQRTSTNGKTARRLNISRFK